MLESRPRQIEFWTCCGQRCLNVTLSADELSGEAWRLARCLKTTHFKARGNGVVVESRRTNLELAEAAGWTPAYVETLKVVYGPDWTDRRRRADWRLQAFHVWIDHVNGPHPDPGEDELRWMALDYLRREARRIEHADCTVVSSGDGSVRLLPDGWGETTVCLPDEQREAAVERAAAALFGDR